MIGMTWGQGAKRVATMAAILLNLHPISAIGQGAATEWREVHMGMEVRIVAHGPRQAAAAASARAFERIAELDAVLSDWRRDSELTRLAAAPSGTWQPVSEPLWSVLGQALEVAKATDGAFDPTIGPLTLLWREARRTGRPADSAAIIAARQQVGWRSVALDTSRHTVRFDLPGMRLDLGAIAKGWILGEARRTMVDAGVGAVLIEAGGDLVVGAAPPGTRGWRIAVATSRGDSVIVVSHAAVATSGPGAQWIVDGNGVRRSHVVDPADGRGRVAQPTITVMGRDPALTDALATALTLVPPERRTALAEHFGVTVVAIHERR